MAPPKSKATASFENLPVVGKILLGGLLLSLVGALYFFAFHMTLSDDMSRETARSRQLQTDAQNAERRRNEYLAATQELAAREGADRANKRILPTNAEIPAFLQDINRVAELSGLTIQLVEPKPEETAELYVRIPVAVKVTGRFHQLAKFFYNVSRLERAINMENIALHDPEVNEADEVLLEVEALATTFRRPEQSAAGAAAPAAAAPARNRGGH